MPNPIVVDLSHYNTDVDFGRMRAAGVAGVIHKATQGTAYVDPAYAHRKPLALQAGLLWGAYHFGTGDDVTGQVTNFLDATRPDGTFLLALDFEGHGSDSMSLPQAKQCLATVETWTRQRPVLYTGDYLNECVDNQPDPSLTPYRVWWAQYASAPSRLNPTWPNYWLWQYSDGTNGPDEKVIDGASPCDCNAFNGNEAELRAAWL